jgi:hypothetical protein
MTIKRFLQTLFTPNYEDIETLVRAFPSTLDNDVRTVTSLLPFQEREIQASDGIVRRVDISVLTLKTKIIIAEVGGERVQIPCRVYFNEPHFALVERLTSVQQSILHCIYLRSHNGYIRQKHLESLRGISEDFVHPFVIQLLGEYVVEILDVLDRLFTDSVADAYAPFLLSNSFYWKQTQSRMISYWDAYYRQDFPKLNQYVGKHIIDRLNSATRRMDSNRLR